MKEGNAQRGATDGRIVSPLHVITLIGCNLHRTRFGNSDTLVKVIGVFVYKIIQRCTNIVFLMTIDHFNVVGTG